MSVMSRLPRRDPLSPDEAVRRYVEAIRSDLEPDPMFRRRLRGTVTNQFVARREGAAVPSASPLGRQMGTLGRACLYASFGLALSVGGVMAASETAIPGDLLYPLKRSIEEMRMEVAPAHLRDDLAAYELGERLDELSRLVENGAWQSAATLARSVEASYEEFVAMAGADVLEGDRLDAQLAHLVEVLESAPVGAREAIVNAMAGAPGLQLDDPGQGNAKSGSGNKAQGQGDGANNGSANGAENGNGTSNGGGPDGAGAPGQATPTPTPDSTPEPASEEDRQSEQAEPTPKPVPTPMAHPTPNPSPTADPEDVDGDGS
jgi:hypothetical protein